MFDVGLCFVAGSPVPDYKRATVDTVMRIHFNEKPGDVLAFLTGMVRMLLGDRSSVRHSLEHCSPSGGLPLSSSLLLYTQPTGFFYFLYFSPLCMSILISLYVSFIFLS